MTSASQPKDSQPKAGNGVGFDLTVVGAGSAGFSAAITAVDPGAGSAQQENHGATVTELARQGPAIARATGRWLMMYVTG